MFEYLRVAADDHQHVIEVVRDTAGQLPQRLHLLRLGELILCAPQFRSCFMALSDVAHDIRETEHPRPHARAPREQDSHRDADCNGDRHRDRDQDDVFNGQIDDIAPQTGTH